MMQTQPCMQQRNTSQNTKVNRNQMCDTATHWKHRPLNSRQVAILASHFNKNCIETKHYLNLIEKKQNHKRLKEKQQKDVIR